MATDDEKLEIIRDKILDGPRARIQEFARSIGVGYEELMEHAELFVDSDGDHSWNEGDRFDGVGLYDRFWPDYELVTRRAVPAKIQQWGFFSCAC